MRYLGKVASELEPKIVDRGKSALQHLEDALCQRQFLVGESLTLADVALVAYTRVADEGGFDLTMFPAVRRWIAAVEQALNIA